MKLAIMQPYFVPYIGYWQLMNLVDCYVVYDDVNFIKGGWINRNRILIDNQAKYFNIPMLGASSNKLIKDIFVNNQQEIINKNLRILMNAYRKAPYFELVYPLMELILKCGKETLSEYIIYSFYIICKYLNIKTKLILSSSLEKDCTLKKQEKVLAICKLLNASEYYNAIGGQKLYNDLDFKEKGIKLKFINTNYISYKQYGSEFQSNLSIVDVMMFNSREEVQNLLKKYEILSL